MDRNCDALIVGAGFAGLYMLHRLRGMGLDARIVEAAGDVGGTWYWNRYPGARCDVESLVYCYWFDDALADTWQWSERFATQPEILSYINHVADRYDLRRDISFDTRVLSARFDDARDRWTVTTDRDERIDARFVIMATGCLSAGRLPDLPGIESFRGEYHHTGRWPHEPVDFTGKRVAVIGTGSSGIQAIPEIARSAAHLHVFQRTPSFTAPARNAPLDAAERALIRDNRATYRQRLRSGEITGFGDVMTDDDLRTIGWTVRGADLSESERQAVLARRWAHGGGHFMFSFADLLTDPDVNESAANFVRARIREIVDDPATAELLSPTDYPIATKRICVDSDYWATFNRPNVTLVDARANPIEALTPDGLRAGGTEHAFDIIVFATGFDAMTGAVLRVDFERHDGRTLRDAWADGPRTYLGLAVAGFPNLFLVTGPQSPSVLSNVVHSIEQHVEWIADCIGHMEEKGATRIEAEEQAQEEWVDHVNALAAGTLFPQAASWYMGANVPGKPRVFMPYPGGVGRYRETCDAVAADGYRGFRIR